MHDCRRLFISPVLRGLIALWALTLFAPLSHADGNDNSGDQKDPGQQSEPSAELNANPGVLYDYFLEKKIITVIDARSPEEYAEQHLPGAINIPFDQIDAYEASLPEDSTRPIVVYCRTGRRANLLQEELTAWGYHDVQILPVSLTEAGNEEGVIQCSGDVHSESGSECFSL